MSNATQSDVTYINRLADFIKHEYNLEPLSITPTKRGASARTWRMDTLKKSYFLKLHDSSMHKSTYENSFHIVKRMCDHGIDFINKVIKTSKGNLCAHFDSAILGVFEWIDGENIQDERTKRAEHQMLAKIYTVPTDGLNIMREDFSTKSADLFFTQCEDLKSKVLDESTTSILELLDQKSEKTIYLADKLKLFSDQCRSDDSCFFITHGEVSSNIMVNGNEFYIVDWDNPIIAPPERDAWFSFYWGWALPSFNVALLQNGINYTIRPERIAYYCYYSFFLNLTLYLKAYLNGSNGRNVHARLSKYLSGCWIDNELNYAEKISWFLKLFK